MSNKSNTLYTGITNNLERRVYEHKSKLVEGFTARYNINRLVYSEQFTLPQEAIEAEKKIKGWTRAKKMKLIKTKNPEFGDLSGSF